MRGSNISGVIVIQYLLIVLSVKVRLAPVLWELLFRGEVSSFLFPFLQKSRQGETIASNRRE